MDNAAVKSEDTHDDLGYVQGFSDSVGSAF